MKITYLFFILFISIITGCNKNPGKKTESIKVPDSAEPVSNGVMEEKKDTDITSVSTDSLQILLKGKWLREDGTYTIEIFSISADGVMDAGYFNPNPINVGKSGWMVNEGNIMLEITLKDVNYPGSKYNLFYDIKSDCLIGNYFQAVQGINYDVLFSRMKQ